MSDADQGANERSRVDEWQRRLLDISLRNDLLNTRMTTRQIELIVPDAAELEDELAAGRSFCIEEANGDQVAAGALKKGRLLATSGGRLPLPRRLQKLYRTARTNLEETGSAALYVAIGYLRWKPADKADKECLAPLVLVPVEIRRSGTQYRLEQSGDGEGPRFNMTLLEMLRRERILLPELEGELPADKRGVDVPQIMALVQQRVSHMDGWGVENRASVGIFSFATYLMWKDLTERHTELLQNDIVRHLAATRRGAFPAGADFPKVADIEAQLPPEAFALPSSADGTQLSAVLAAEQGKSFVLIGPPGTGKSQTITNIIARCLGAGKTVLFVAEKSAALQVVYKRLCRIGLGDFCLRLHSNKANKGEVLRQFDSVRSMTVEFDAAAQQQNLQQLAEKRTRLSAVHSTLHTRRADGSTLLHEMITELAGRDLPEVPTAPLREDAETLRALQQTAEQLDTLAEPLRNYFGTAAMGLKLPAGCTPAEEQTAAALMRSLRKAECACDAARAELCAALNLEPTSADTTETDTALLKVAELIPGGRAARPLPAEALLRPMRDYAAAQASLSVPYTADAEMQDDPAELQRRWREAAVCFAPIRWWKQRGLRRKLAVLAYPNTPTAPESDLAALVTMRKAREEANALLTERASTERPAAVLREATRQRQAARKAAEAVCDPELLPANAEQAGELADAIEGDPLLCRQIALWKEAEAAARAAGFGMVPDWLLNATCAPGEAARLARTVYARNATRRAVQASPELSRFTPLMHERLVGDFCDKDNELTERTSTAIRHALWQRSMQLKDPRYAEELNILQRELTKKRAQMPLRRLVENLPNLMPLLKPCMLMSPLSVAQFLNMRKEPFDLVIFDEASQMRVCDAVGALARGKNAVIVGDPHQMPPTDFFSGRDAEDEDDEETEHDLESILDECLACGVPSMQLQWHYRSRAEQLIAFSNNRYYGGELVTFPAPQTRNTALQLHRVRGVYRKGSTRTNPQEAAALVDHVVRTLTAPGFVYTEMTSIGIVTFNNKQQELIADLLDEARAANPALDRFFDEELPEAVFVKNLESVQGDERGIIYFSTTFGRDKDGSMSMNFGPLNKQGGERRLNVAITRARAGMHVFTSMDPEDIDTTRTSAQGVADLRGFLETAAKGTPAVDNMKNAEGTGLSGQVAEGLRGLGWECRRCPGATGMQADVAVVHPQEPDRFLALVRTDGDGTPQSTRDRVKQRDLVLAELGWDVLHLWAADWWRNTQDALARLDAALHALVKRGPKPAREWPDLLADRAPIADEAEETEEETTGETAPPPAYEAYVPTHKLTSNPATWERAVLQAVRTEGPVTAERLAQALSGESKLSATARSTVFRAAVDTATALETRQQLITEWEQDGTGGTQRVYRLPEQDAVRVRTAGPRSMEQIPPSEVRALGKQVCETEALFPTSEAHIRRVAKLLGLRATAGTKDTLARLLREE